MATITSRVIASNEDANEYPAGGTTYLTWSTAYVGSVGGVGLNYGVRFSQNIAGLSGSTINAGTKLTFRAFRSDSGSFQGDWWGEDAAGPLVFTTASGNISGRTKSTATCEGDSGDFGAWTGGQDHDFVGDGVNTIADIIQELATSYDPSAIVFFHLYSSGTRKREPKPYDATGGAATAPLLTIDHTASTGLQTLAATAIAATFTLPAATLAPSTAATLTATAIVAALVVPAATLSGASVATLASSPAVATFTVPAATLGPAGAATLTATAASPTFVVPIARLTIVGAQFLVAPEISATFVVSAATLVGVGTAVLAASPASPTFVVPTATLDPDTATLTATAAVVTFTIVSGDATLIPRRTTLTATAIAVTWVVPEAILSGGTLLLGFEAWGDITQWIDPDECAPGAVFLLQAAIFTSNAGNPVTARLFDVAAGREVADSHATSTSTTLAAVRSSSTFSLTSGLREYRLDFGGPSGAVVYCQGGEVKGVSS